MKTNEPSKVQVLFFLRRHLKEAEGDIDHELLAKAGNSYKDRLELENKARCMAQDAVCLRKAIEIVERS